MHRIDKAPFYAALIPFAVNDSIGGLKIDGHCQVIDIYGKPIPGLFAGGEASGGGRAAWHRPRVCPWLYGGDVRGCRTGHLT